MKDEKKKYGLIGVRMSLEEADKVRQDALFRGYPSVSNYCRDILVGKRIMNHKKFMIDDTILQAQIAEISTKLSKIGHNYNQVVRRINTNTKILEEQGRTEDTRATIFFLNKLEKSTEEIIKMFTQLSSIMEKIYEKIQEKSITEGN